MQKPQQDHRIMLSFDSFNREMLDHYRDYTGIVRRQYSFHYYEYKQNP